MKRFFYSFSLLFCSVVSVTAQEQPAYLDASKDVETRVKDLISRLTLKEKTEQLMDYNPSIERLHIPEYNWWNEGLHGVGRSGIATVFPQAIGLAATFDTDLAKREATVISDEARAMYNVASAKDYHSRYSGLTFWTPNINIFRDPRWGRGQETYGEDPYLTSRLGVAFVEGMQGNDSKYLKVAACAKHFAVHSGPEKVRHEFNAVANNKDLFETYLPAFKALVKEANVEAVMCAYNSTNGEPCCGNTFLLQDVLRKQWQFKGHVVSDCWAITDIYKGHQFVKDAAEAAAIAVKRGVSLNCGDEFPALVDAVAKGYITEKEIDEALAILLRTKFRLGLFDDPKSNPYYHLNAKDINTAEHRALAKEVALKSIVLLKNKNNILPLKNDLRKYFVTGPNAANADVLIGNYYGVNDHMVTILEGIVGNVAAGSQVQYRPGCLLDRENINPIDWTTTEAGNTDANIVVLGISGLLEGEEGDAIASPSNGDRLDYSIPKNQIEFLRKMRTGNTKPLITIITGGSPMNLTEIQELSDAVLMVWYPGEEGGNAVADILFGRVSPSGKLPITFPKSLDQLPAFENYSMQGRTYRYMQAEPLYPFGFGLSYTSFKYSNAKVSATTVAKGKPVTVSAMVTNSGSVAGEEVVQLYTSQQVQGLAAPIRSLKGFKRIKLEAGASQEVQFELSPEMLSLVDNNGNAQEMKGKVMISIGGSQPDQRSIELGANTPASIDFNIK